MQVYGSFTLIRDWVYSLKSSECCLLWPMIRETVLEMLVTRHEKVESCRCIPDYLVNLLPR
jgi:hypothetical protein